MPKIPIWVLLAVLLPALVAIAEQNTRKKTRILILGDSLTEGYGVEKEEAFPALLDAKLKKWEDRFEVVNGGSSGSTSASGVRRLKWYAKAQPDIVLLALGSNDGLRGVKAEETRKNVEEAILFCRGKGWKVLMAGLKVPPNYGAEYASAFENVYTGLAERYRLPMAGFLLEGVAGEPGMNQADGIHPNELGHERIAENLFRFFKTLLASPG